MHRLHSGRFLSFYAIKWFALSIIFKQCTMCSNNTFKNCSAMCTMASSNLVGSGVMVPPRCNKHCGLLVSIVCCLCEHGMDMCGSVMIFCLGVGVLFFF